MSDKAIVHVVDDDQAVRESMRAVLQAARYHVSVYESGEELLERLDTSIPGCVILDLKMPGKSGMEIMDDLCAMEMTPSIIVVTGHGDVPIAVKAMTMGAVNFLEKPFDSHALLENVKKGIDQDLLRHKRRDHRLLLQKQMKSLNHDQTRVLELICEGMPNKEIAQDLGVSLRTMHTRRNELMLKIGANNRAEINRFYLFNKVATSPEFLTENAL